MIETTNARDVVESYFKAMQAGQSAQEELVALFADDAVYIEPFAGEPTAHVGRKAIGDWMAASCENAPPDLTLTLDRVDVDGPRVRSEWTCAAPMFPQPMRGRDEFIVESGKIKRLETTMLTQMPG
jgi:uncharacterized protein (TIGR02246 family)